MNLLSAVLALAACLFYVVRLHALAEAHLEPQNIVIGGAAGAVPVLIGWSAVTDSLAWAPSCCSPSSSSGRPPHFWALAIRYKDDYAAADVPMLPSVATLRARRPRSSSTRSPRRSSTLVFVPVADLGWIYAVAAIVLGCRVHRRRRRAPQDSDPEGAMRLFSWSITYVTLLFGAMALDVFVQYGC